jgi:NAD dependent epimerase/dehydratase family enzyme
VVILRTSVVLDRRGGALKSMLLPFKLGVGGVVGSGEQYFATISLSDWLRAVTFLAVDEGGAGVFNVTGPDCSTNAEFTAELGKALHRPTVLKVPALPLRRLAGPIGGEMLASTRVEPQRLLDAGFAFSHNDVADRIAAALR